METEQTIKEVKNAINKGWEVDTPTHKATSIWINKPQEKGIVRKFIGVNNNYCVFFLWSDETLKFSKLKIEGDFTKLYAEIERGTNITIKGFSS